MKQASRWKERELLLIGRFHFSISGFHPEIASLPPDRSILLPRPLADCLVSHLGTLLLH